MKESTRIYNRIMEGDPTSRPARLQRSLDAAAAAAGVVDTRKDREAAQAEIDNVGTGKNKKRGKPVQGKLPFGKDDSSVEVEGSRIEEKIKGYQGADQPVPSIDPELLDDSNAKLMEYEKKSKAYWERARMGSELLGGKKMSPKERRKTSLTKTRKDRKRDAKRSEAAKKRAEAKKNAPEPEWSPLDDPTHYL